jgi:hypothetical protein
MPANECIPLYDDGDEIPVEASAPLTGKTFAVITGRHSGYQAGTGIAAGLDTDASGGNYLAAVPAAGVKIAGVVSYDVGTGEKVTLLRRKILPVTTGTGGAVAGAEVQSDGAGKAIPVGAGAPVGLCLKGATIGLDAEILVY